VEKKDSKSAEDLLKEEQDKLLDEINEKTKQRKRRMNPDAKYDTDNELLR